MNNYLKKPPGALFTPSSDTPSFTQMTTEQHPALIMEELDKSQIVNDEPLATRGNKPVSELGNQL